MKIFIARLRLIIFLIAAFVGGAVFAQEDDASDEASDSAAISESATKTPSKANKEPPPIYKVQAVLIMKFVSYIEWPSERDKNDFSVLKICLLGDSDIKKSADLISKKMDGIKYKFALLPIKSLKNASSTCHILFIGESEEDKLDSILAEIKSEPILTVSDIESFIDSGGMIGFVPKKVNGELKPKFEVNKKAIQAAHLSVDAEMLEIAIRVK